MMSVKTYKERKVMILSQDECELIEQYRKFDCMHRKALRTISALGVGGCELIAQYACANEKLKDLMRAVLVFGREVQRCPQETEDNTR